MKSIMEYMIEAEESALDNYLNDALYEAESLPFLENAFEDAAVIPATGVVKDSETSPIKEKFSIWNWIKGVIHRIGEFFRRIFGLTKETKDAVNKAASKKSESPRSIQPTDSSNASSDKTEAKAARSVIVDRLNKIRVSYADATRKAVKVVFDAASATCAFIDKMSSRWKWEVPKGKAFTDEFSRIEELYENANIEYGKVTEVKAEYEEAKKNISSLRNVSRFLTWMNINDVNATCDLIEAACKKHYEYCDAFVKSADADKSTYGEKMHDSEKNFYVAAKQYLKVASLANKAAADFRACAAEVYNGDKL